MEQNNHVKLSVIVPIYNMERYLEKCVQSIINQTEKSLQIILVDDGSKDKSLEIAQKLAATDERVISLHKENDGCSRARNYGKQYATGDYITFVDSDDWLESEMYEKMLEAAYRYDADVVTSDASLREDEVLRDDKILPSYFLRGGVSCCTKIFKHKGTPLEKHEIGKFDPDTRTSFDFIKKAKCMVWIPGSYYNYRQDNVSEGRSKYKTKDTVLFDNVKGVADETKEVNPKAYMFAYFHVVHAEMDLICKYIDHGYETIEDKKHYKSVRKGYCQDVRKNLKECLVSSYFSKNEKLQLRIISISYPLFVILRKLYVKCKPKKKITSVQI